MLNYRKTFFDPGKLAGFSRVADPDRDDWAYDAGPGTDDAQRHYVFAQEAVLAINVALATRRPLLVSGEPGSGKTSLARFAAEALGRVFYRHTVTSRMQASDLLSDFDALQRLSDAQVKKALRPTQAYVRPGPLWWALSPVTARQRGVAALQGLAPLTDPGTQRERADDAAKAQATAALLLDEIDKADPDVPNDLLESLDERSFTVPQTGDRIDPARDDVLIVLTTNGERELPPAFLRRCVTVELPKPTRRWLVDLATRRFGGGEGPFEKPLYERLASEVITLRELADAQGRRPPSTSEFVDSVATCRELLDSTWSDQHDGSGFERILDAVLAKRASSGPLTGA